MRPGAAAAVLPLLFTLWSAPACSSAKFEGEKSPSFDKFLAARGRAYENGSTEYHSRLALYQKRAAKVDAHNAKSDRRWTASVGLFADRTDEEIKSVTGWRRGSGREGVRSSVPGGPHATALRGNAVGKWSLPDNFDWKHLKAVQNVKDQGECGSCWAVSSMSVLEAHHEIATNTSMKFSVQEIISCAPNPRHCGGDGGCDGATAEIAFDFALKHGLVTEQEYPYTQRNAVCPQTLVSQSRETTRQRTESLGMWGWERLPKNRYAPLMRAVVEQGPVVVAVAVTDGDDPIMFYSGGIYDGCRQDAVLDHAMMLIGYGEEAKGGTKFWTLQNSWGTEWGDHGRMRLLRGESDETTFCGTDAHPEEGSGCQGGPSSVRVCGMCGILYEGVVPRFQRSKVEAREFVAHRHSSPVVLASSSEGIARRRAIMHYFGWK